MHQRDKFNMKEMYMALIDEYQLVQWKKVLYNNVARPRVLVVMWLACHERLATKERLHIFGMLDNDKCCFCPKGSNYSISFV